MTAPLHVLEILGRGGLGPMELHVLRLVEGLQLRGMRVSAICPDDGPARHALRGLGCEVTIMQMGDDPSFASVRDAAWRVLDDDVDILHAHYANAHVLAVLAAAASGRPCIATLHGPQVGMRDLEAHQLGRRTQLHVLSEVARRHARAIGVAPRSLHRIGNDDRPLGPAAGAAPASLASCPIVGILAPAPCGSPAAGVAPEATGPAGRDDAADAPGHDADGAPAAAWQRVEHALRTLGCTPRVLGCTPPVLNRRPSPAQPGPGTAWTRSLAACVVADAAGVAGAAVATPRLLDALAAGVPVIAPAGTALDEVLHDGEDALLLRDADPSALAQAAAALVADRPRRLALGGAARAHARGWPDPRMIDGVANLLRHVARPDGGSDRTPALGRDRRAPMAAASSRAHGLGNRRGRASSDPRPSR